MEEKLQEKLMMKKEKGWLSKNDDEKEQILRFSDGYINYLNIAKTEIISIQFFSIYFFTSIKIPLFVFQYYTIKNTVLILAPLYILILPCILTQRVKECYT